MLAHLHACPQARLEKALAKQKEERSALQDKLIGMEAEHMCQTHHLERFKAKMNWNEARPFLIPYRVSCLL